LAGQKREISDHWDRIPEDSNIVVVHTPAYGVLDQNASGEHEGSKELLRKLVKVEPNYFVAVMHTGLTAINITEGIHFINAALSNDEFKIIHKPVFQWYP